MKRTVLLIGLLLLLLCGTALAANHVESIEIAVQLQRDGSAQITQYWTGDFTEGTEGYLPIEDRSLTVDSLVVSCDDSVYETLDGWDVDASLEEKAGRCGIRQTEKGYELCWGLSSYGRHCYAFTYRVDPVVKRYSDEDAACFMLVNPNMNIGPSSVAIWIYSEDFSLTEQNTRAWAYGLDGEVGFAEDGSLCVWSDSDLTAGNYVVVLFTTERGLLSPAVAGEGSFEELKARAMQGSDYETEDDDRVVWLFYIIGGSVIFGLIALFIAVSIANGRKRRRAMTEWVQAYGTDGSEPCGGDLVVAWRLGRLYDIVPDEGSVIGALLLALLREGCLVPVNGFGGDRRLRLSHAPAATGSAQWELFGLLMQAADPNGDLHPDYVKRCFEDSPELMRDMLDSWQERADAYMMSCGWFTGRRPDAKPEHAAESARRELASLWSLRQLLRGERKTAGGELMDPYTLMVYALLLGIKREEVRGIRAFYPDRVWDDWDVMDDYYWCSCMYCDHTYGAMHRAEEERSSGSGGSSSSGGGGGFSGGGSGGGTR